MKLLLKTCVVLLIGASLPAIGSAQQPTFGRPGTPTVTPYLNLIPGYNLSPALTYYRSYRPEREFRQDAQQFNRSINTLQREVDELAVAQQKTASMLSATGHHTYFHNLGSYYPRSSAPAPALLQPQGNSR